MDQVKNAPPSGCVESDYETIAGLRYKGMPASKGKSFPFKHAWAILRTFDKWKLRDQVELWWRWRCGGLHHRRLWRCLRRWRCGGDGAEVQLFGDGADERWKMMIL